MRQRTSQFGSPPEGEQAQSIFLQLLKDKISKTNIEMVKADVGSFIKNLREMDIWSTEYFTHLVDMIQFEKSID